MTHLSSSRFDLAALLARDEPPRPSQRTPEAVRPAEFVAFETGDHTPSWMTIPPVQMANGIRAEVTGPTTITLTLASADSATSGAGLIGIKAPSPEAAPASGGKFKVGDRVRLSREVCRSYRIKDEFNQPWVISRIEDGRAYDAGGSYGKLDEIELVLPPKEVEGLVPKPMKGRVYLCSHPARGKPMFHKWNGEHFCAGSLRAVTAATYSTRSLHDSGYTVIREATEAELKGEA